MPDEEKWHPTGGVDTVTSRPNGITRTTRVSSIQHVANFAQKLAAEFPETGLLLYKTHPHLTKGAPDDSKWLEIDKLRDEDDTSLEDCNRFHHQAKYHKNLEQVRHRHVWFLSESGDAEHHKALREAIRIAGLWEKECLL